MAFLQLNIEGLYGNLQPIKASFEFEKKELKGNDYLKLFGALSLLALNNQELIQDYYCMSLKDVIDSACIQDNELYLFNFEGYELNDRLTLKTLYLTQYDNVIMSVYDNKKDRYIDFVA